MSIENKSIAIILGVIDYLDDSLQLPACKKDVELVEAVLRRGGRFSEIIVIPSSDARALKANLAETIKRFQHEQIQDLFFYYTGHGEFADDGFHYLLRDYSSSRNAATSLENSELDAMLKSLSPKLAIKVVDACYSGMSYIKDGSKLDDYVNSDNVFSNCYFFFSSQRDQKSYASKDVSDFTSEFVKSVANSSSDAIRYKDIIDSISDAFSSRSQQRPLFVAQADYTDVFGNYSSTSRDEIKSMITQQNFEAVASTDEVFVAPSQDTLKDEKQSLRELVEIEARRYVTLDQAQSFVLSLQEALNMSLLPSEIEDIYETNSEWFDDYKRLPNPKPLGEWVKANKDQEYFAVPTYTNEYYEVDDPADVFIRISGGKSRTITKSRNVISGLESTIQDVPFLSYRLILKPKYPNLVQYAAWFAFAISKTSIEVFFSFVEYEEISWDNYRPGLMTNWNQCGFDLVPNSSCQNIVKVFRQSFVDWVSEKVKARLAKNTNSK